MPVFHPLPFERVRRNSTLLAGIALLGNAAPPAAAQLRELLDNLHTDD